MLNEVLPSKGRPYVVDPPRQNILRAPAGLFTGKETSLKYFRRSGAVDAVPSLTEYRGWIPENPTNGSSAGCRAGMPRTLNRSSTSTKKRTQTARPIGTSRRSDRFDPGFTSCCFGLGEPFRLGGGDWRLLSEDFGDFRARFIGPNIEGFDGNYQNRSGPLRFV